MNRNLMFLDGSFDLYHSNCMISDVIFGFLSSGLLIFVRF